MTKVKDGGMAFPWIDMESGYESNGLSLRDYFAAAALQGMIAKASFDLTYTTIDDVLARIAQRSWKLADAVLAEREK